MDYRLLSIGLFSLLTGCAGGGSGNDDARLSRAMASLMETAELSAARRADSTRAHAMADSALAAAGWTRREFDAACRGMQSDPERWRGVSEDAAKLVEQRLAAGAR